MANTEGFSSSEGRSALRSSSWDKMPVLCRKMKVGWLAAEASVCCGWEFPKPLSASFSIFLNEPSDSSFCLGWKLAGARALLYLSGWGGGCWQRLKRPRLRCLLKGVLAGPSQ